MKKLVQILRVLAVALLIASSGAIAQDRKFKGQLCLNNRNGRILVRQKCRRAETRIDSETLVALQGQAVNPTPVPPAPVVIEERKETNTCKRGISSGRCSVKVCCKSGETLRNGGVSSNNKQVLGSAPGGSCWSATIDVPAFQTGVITAWAQCQKS